MLQNVGKLVIAAYFKEAYHEIEQLKEEKKMRSPEAERRVLGLSHGEIGAIVLKKFKISQDICDAVSFHDSANTKVQNDANLHRVFVVA